VEGISSDIELHVSMMNMPAGMARTALRPKVAFWRVCETLRMPTLLPDEYNSEYL
jgi:hypothetical protein